MQILLLVSKKKKQSNQNPPLKPVESGGARQQNVICCQANGLILLPAQKNKIKNKTNMHLIVSGIWVFCWHSFFLAGLLAALWEMSKCYLFWIQNLSQFHLGEGVVHIIDRVIVFIGLALMIIIS